VALYKLFLLRPGEPVVQISRDCADDLDALDVARSVCGNHAVEVYCNDNLIARVKLNDEPLDVMDAQSG